MSARIVWISADRAMHVMEPDGSQRQLTGTPDPALMWANWGAPSEAPASHTWPTFSPDGLQIAAFKVTANEAAVLVTDLDGVQSALVIELPDQLPIYLQWSADGERIGVVSQQSDTLLLTVGRGDGSSPQKVLVNGSPLFFTWTPSGKVAAFVGGGSPEAKMMLIDPNLRAPSEVLPGVPGDFCAPIVVNEGLLYGAHQEGVASILQYRSGEPTRALVGGEGLMAFVPSPDGASIARAVAPGGDGTPYQALSVIDVATGAERSIGDIQCLSFFWAGDNALVVARVDADRGVVEWSLLDLHGNLRHVADLLPSRDMRFYLRFFEQYASSHPIVDPEGRYLVLSGVLSARGTLSKVWKIPLAGGQPTALGKGRFACFGPQILN